MSSSQRRSRQVSLGLYVELHSAKFWTVENIYPATSHCSTNSSSLAASAQSFLCQASELLSLYGKKNAWTVCDNGDSGDNLGLNLATKALRERDSQPHFTQVIKYHFQVCKVIR